MGILFGLYYSCEVLATKREYEAALPANDGYPAFETAIKLNPLSRGEQPDSETYVRIHKSDFLHLRLEKEPSWASQLKKKQKLI